MFVWSANVARGTDKSVVSLPDFADWRDANRTFSGLAVAQSVTYNLSGSDRPVRVAASQVSANYFSLLGVSPQIGRTFREGEDRVGSPVVAVLSHGLWQRAFGAEAGVVGRDILLDGSPATVIGVMPQGFEIQFGELWLPLTTDPRSGDRRGALGLRAWAPGRRSDPDAGCCRPCRDCCASRGGLPNDECRLAGQPGFILRGGAWTGIPVGARIARRVGSARASDCLCQCGQSATRSVCGVAFRVGPPNGTGRESAASRRSVADRKCHTRPLRWDRGSCLCVWRDVVCS